MKANDRFATYLNDHLAGSVIALELLNELSDRPEVAAIRAEIEADRLVLEQLLAKLDVAPSPTRQAAAWITDKLGKLKLRLNDPTNGTLRELEILETVSIGIAGKASLWATLHHLDRTLGLGLSVDFPTLIARAEEQSARMVPLRLAAATMAFAKTQ